MNRVPCPAPRCRMHVSPAPGALEDHVRKSHGRWALEYVQKGQPCRMVSSASGVSA